MEVTVHKFTVADSFDFSQFNSCSMSLRWDCERKAPYSDQGLSQAAPLRQSRAAIEIVP